jgi:hypothetical protein
MFNLPPSHAMIYLPNHHHHHHHFQLCGHMNWVYYTINFFCQNSWFLFKSSHEALKFAITNPSMLENVFLFVIAIPFSMLEMP